MSYSSNRAEVFNALHDRHNVYWGQKSFHHANRDVRAWIAVAFLSALFLIFMDPNSVIDKDIVLTVIGVISFGVSVIGILWHLMLMRTHSYVEIYYNLVIRAQSLINFNILIPDDENKKIDFGRWAKYKTKNIINFIFYSGHIIFLSLTLIVVLFLIIRIVFIS